MANIRSFIQDNLLEPLKSYPTTIQDTTIELIAQRLESLYDYTYKFPEILSPNQERLDILKTIADQFLFTVREDASIEEQISILNNILYVYKKRGSVDTIENMWKYYGGNLPKDVKVVIPSYNLFRYSISKLSGSDKFIKGDANYVILDTPSPEYVPIGSLAKELGTTRYRATTSIIKGSNRVYLTTVDGLSLGSTLSISVNKNGILEEVYQGIIQEIYEAPKEGLNRTGVYEIKLSNNRYPIPELKEFLLKELVAAGNYIYFTNELYMSILGEEENVNPYKYLVRDHTLVDVQMQALRSIQGLTWSGYNTLSNKYRDSIWSGKESIFLSLTRMLDLEKITMSQHSYEDMSFLLRVVPTLANIIYLMNPKIQYTKLLQSFSYCTPEDKSLSIARYLYNSQGDILDSSQPGYFILGETLLGKEVI